MKLQVRDIIADNTIDIRDRMDETTILEYIDIFDRLPAITVFDTPEGYLLADGFHRLSAAERLGRNEIEAEVKTGTRDDALEFAAYANATAPLKLTTEERRVGVRRLHRLHPDWSPQRLGELMACSERVVNTTLQAIEVRREAPTAHRLPERAAQEIARAPKEYWEPLAKVAVEKDWTTDEVALAARNLSDPSLPAEHRRALINGDSEPITRVGGEPAFLRETVNRHMAKEAERDYLSFMESALYQLAQLRRFQAREVVDGLEVQRLASLVRGLPGDLEYLDEILRLGRERLEMH